MIRRYESWNRYPPVQHHDVIPLFWRTGIPSLDRIQGTVLPFGKGMSYGDTCLNEGGTLLSTEGLSRLVQFDDATGLLRCEAGATLGDLLQVVVPRGWFLSVTPGTQYVSVGGAIAHDVHGKNHHRMGTFGCHVPQFELLRSTGERLICSSRENADLYRATIGGMGLTGLILWADLQLQPIKGPLVSVEEPAFQSLEEFWDLAGAADETFQYTVAWVDAMGSRRRTGRGILMTGDHVEGESRARNGTWRPAVPFDVPGALLNRLTVKSFNAAYYRWHSRRRQARSVLYDRFFYPLDALGNWNRLYGKRGFLQYQCVLPLETALATMGEILTRSSRAGQPSFLTTLKKFGDRRSPGMMSFPRLGATLAVDLSYRGEATLQLLDTLDALVIESGGAVYPAKDARMSSATFRASFPQWSEFATFVDPKFSSMFWRRVTQDRDKSA